MQANAMSDRGNRTWLGRGLLASVVAVVMLGASASGAWAVGPTAYVTRYYWGTVTPIELATDTAGTPIPVGNNPEGIAITPDGKTAYVTIKGDGTVTPIDVATEMPGTPIPVGNRPSEIAITPDGSTAYVTNQDDDTVT